MSIDVGATVRCDNEKNNCKKRFHPECARKANLSLEKKEIEVPQLIGGYLVAEPQEVQVIYCEKHRPLKLRGLLESKDKADREEIVKFCRTIENIYQINVSELKGFKEYQRQQLADIAAIESLPMAQPSKKKKQNQPEIEADPFLQQVEEMKKIIPTTKHFVYVERKEYIARDLKN